MIRGIGNLTYKDTLKYLNKHSLERRRVRKDMIKVSRVSTKGTRTNGFKLDNFRYRKDIGKIWFTNKVVEEWNTFNKHVVSSGAVYIFKNILDISLDE